MNRYSLFITKDNSIFEKGTILPLEAEPQENGYFLPDEGNGKHAWIQPDQLIPCPAFSENIPPGKCPVKITSSTLFDKTNSAFTAPIHVAGFSNISILSNIHFQQIRISTSVGYQKPLALSFTNRLTETEIEYTDYPAIIKTNACDEISFEISHHGPGFYELKLILDKNLFIVIKCIKFFPLYVEAKFDDLIHGAGNKITRQSSAENTNCESGNEFLKFITDKAIAFNLEFDQSKINARVMNKAIALLTEWGENFRKPIDEHIKNLYPELENNEIAFLTRAGREAESFIYKTCERELEGEIKETDIYETVKLKYPWLADDHIFRLKNIGMFYARK